MNQAVKIKTHDEINTSTQDGWRFWKTVTADDTVEYVLSARKNSPETSRVMTEAMTALLKGLSSAVLLGDAGDTGDFARMVMRHMSDRWPDCRLMARSTGAVFVAIADENDQSDNIYRLMEMARHQKGAGIRLVGYREAVMPEVRFANLCDGGADIELVYCGGKQPMLRICMNPKAFSKNECWARLQRCWQDATAQ